MVMDENNIIKCLQVKLPILKRKAALEDLARMGMARKI